MIIIGTPAEIRPVKYGKRKIATPAYIRIVSTIRRMLFVTFHLSARLQANLNRLVRLRCEPLPNGFFQGPQYRISYSS
jgi:hypothetical protein